jgi:flagellar hook-length control protein FliK
MLNPIGVANRGENRGQDSTAKQGKGQLFSALMAQNTPPSTLSSEPKSKPSAAKEKASSDNSTTDNKTTADRGARTDTPKDASVKEKAKTAKKAENQDNNQAVTEQKALQPAKNDQPEHSSAASQTEKTLSDEGQANQSTPLKEEQLSVNPSLVDNSLLLSSFAVPNNPVDPVSAGSPSDAFSNNVNIGNGLTVSNPIASSTVASAEGSLDSPNDTLLSQAAPENLDAPLAEMATPGSIIVDNQPAPQTLANTADQLSPSPLQNSLTALQQSDSADRTAIPTPPTAATAATASPNLTPTVNNPLAASTNDFSPALQKAATDSVAPSTDGKINDRFSEHEGKHAGLPEDTEISLTNANPINVVQSPLIVQNTEIAKQATMVPPQAGELAQQVTVAIRKGTTEGTSQMHIKLNPVELGGIDIRMEVDADHYVRAILTIEKPETYDLLHKDAQHLQKLLEESGLKLADANAIQYEQRSSSLANNTNSNQDWLSSGWFGQEGGQAGRHAQNDSGYTAARHPGGDGDDAASTPVNLITYTHGQIDGRVNIRV